MMSSLDFDLGNAFLSKKEILKEYIYNGPVNSDQY